MLGRLLAIFAHPDDESYGPAGTIVEARARGGAVRVITATRGEAGSLGISKEYHPHELARIRQNELVAAARVMDFDPVVLGWPDKGVGAVEHGLAIGTLVREIRLFCPDSILTFHPNGLSGHPDHIAMTALAIEAEGLAARGEWRPELGAAWVTSRHWHYAITESKAAAVAHFRRIHTIPDEAADAVLDVSRYTARKESACLAHVTQRTFLDQLRDARGGLHGFWGTEHLVRAGQNGTSGAG
jgi:LmbE family N-acetylglucosaminyl deacetylase